MSNLSQFKTDRNSFKGSRAEIGRSRAGTSMIASLVEDIDNRCELNILVFDKLTIR